MRNGCIDRERKDKENRRGGGGEDSGNRVNRNISEEGGMCLHSTCNKLAHLSEEGETLLASTILLAFQVSLTKKCVYLS